MTLFEAIIGPLFWAAAIGIGIAVGLFLLGKAFGVVDDWVTIRTPIEKDVPPLTEEDIRQQIRNINNVAARRVAENNQIIRKVVEK